ncbi:MAG TPA: hypothetical protein VEY10_21205 [Flavisolibacter sp.]|jgi:hypothetical protein|nr:hypothetical protein [Flavisolibacter sp.]
MNAESLLPFLFIIAPFAIAFILEAIVLYYFRLQPVKRIIGITIAINLISVGIIFFAAMPLLAKLGYQFNGLNLPPQLVVFLWWFSSVVDGVTLTLFLRKHDKARLFMASILMNFLSYLFLYIFIVNSH